MSAWGVDHGVVAKGLFSDKPKVDRTVKAPVFHTVSGEGTTKEKHSVVMPGLTSEPTGKKTLFLRRPKHKLKPTGAPAVAEPGEKVVSAQQMKLKVAAKGAKKIAQRYDAEKNQ